MKTKLNIIAHAIENKLVLEIQYNQTTRLIEPHHYGILNNKLQLQAYQIAGESISGHSVGWKNFEIAKIIVIKTCNKHFLPQKDHCPQHSNFTVIYKSVR